MKAEFKEKSFERAFGAELGRLTKTIFAPDPCDESYLGFDDSYYIPLGLALRRLPHFTLSKLTRQGLDLRTLAYLSSDLKKVLPAFRLNIFVQYKRPHFLRTARAAQWHHWNCAYYRYSISAAQQSLLARLQANAQGRAAVVYASAAFWEAKTLFRLTQAGEVFDNSNIADVALLNGHHHFTYSAKGAQGIACSEASLIESRPLRELIGELERFEEMDFEAHLLSTSKIILSTVKEDPAAFELFREARSALNMPVRGGRVTNALGDIVAFTRAFDVALYAVG